MRACGMRLAITWRARSNHSGQWSTIARPELQTIRRKAGRRRAERTLILDAGLIGIQAPAEFLQQARILHRLPGESPQVRIRLAEFCKRSSHARDFTIGHLAGQIHTRPGSSSCESPFGGYWRTRHQRLAGLRGKTVSYSEPVDPSAATPKLEQLRQLTAEMQADKVQTLVGVLHQPALRRARGPELFRCVQPGSHAGPSGSLPG